MNTKTEVIKNMNDAIEHEKALKSELEKQKKEFERLYTRLREEVEENRLK